MMAMMIIIIDDCDVDKDNENYNINYINDIWNENEALDMERFILMMMMMSNGGDNDKNKDLLPPTRHRKVLPDGVRPRLWPC